LLSCNQRAPWGIEFGSAHAGSREVGGGHHHRRLQCTAQARKVEAVVNVRRVRCSNEHGMLRGLWPVGEIGCTKIRCVELGSRNLGHAVDATDPCPYRKSNPYVLMVQPSKDGPHLDAPGALNEPSNRRILAY
jgi:hypothetical protein